MELPFFSKRSKRKLDQTDDHDNLSGSFVKKVEDVSSVVEIKYQQDDNNDLKGYDFKPFINELIRCLSNYGGEVVLRLHNDPYHSEYFFRVTGNHIVTIPIQSRALNPSTIQELEGLVAAKVGSAIEIVDLGRRHNQSAIMGGHFDAALKQATTEDEARKACQTTQERMAATQAAEQGQPEPTVKSLFSMKPR